jgi:hypothetical protein
VWFGGPIEWFSITFRILGDNLNPREVTRVLGCKPSESERKGDPILRKDGTVARLARTGSWRLRLTPEDTDEWDCSEAMMKLMKRFPEDRAVWKQLTKSFSIDFFVGLTMGSRNKGFEISPAVMAYLGQRGISVGFDIYYEDQMAEPSPGAPSRSPERRQANRKSRKSHGC